MTTPQTREKPVTQVALAGAGQFGALHLHVFRSLPVEVVALCEPGAAAGGCARGVRKRWRVRLTRRAPGTGEHGSRRFRVGRVHARRGGSAAALTDCGTGPPTEQLPAGIGETDCANRPTRLYLTRYQVNHSGGAAAIRTNHGVRIFPRAETAFAARVGSDDAAQVKRAWEAGGHPSDYRNRRCHVNGVPEQEVARSVGKLTITAYGSPVTSTGVSSSMIIGGTRYLAPTPCSTVVESPCSPFPTADPAPSVRANDERAASLPVDLLLPAHGEVSLATRSEPTA